MGDTWGNGLTPPRRIISRLIINLFSLHLMTRLIILSLAILCIGQSTFARTQISNVLDLTSDVIRPSSY